MANNAKVMDSIKSFLLKMKALDEAIPEELAEDALQMTEEVKDALCEEENNMEDEEPDTVEKNEEDACGTKDEEEKMTEKKIEDTMVNVLKKYGIIRDSAMNSLDELEEELVEDEDVESEEENTVDPEKINDAARRELLRKIKPVIAEVKDSKQRKILSDSFAKALKMNKSTSSAYGDILAVKQKKVSDSMNSHTSSEVDYGMEIAKKWNPHYKEEN